mgnify:CR=1 FL=1
MFELAQFPLPYTMDALAPYIRANPHVLDSIRVDYYGEISTDFFYLCTSLNQMRIIAAMRNVVR